MKTLNKLLDKARSTCSRDSDRCLAEALGVTASAVSVWRKGGKITEDHLTNVIVLAQADPALFVQVRSEEAANTNQQKLWGALWDRLSPVTTVIGGVVLAVCMTPALARSKPIEIKQLSAPSDAFCILCSKWEAMAGATQSAAPSTPGTTKSATGGLRVAASIGNARSSHHSMTRQPIPASTHVHTHQLATRLVQGER